jgi:flavin reductase (DIM6/NTAB) family NADH-FMN oxidoreductase RutF
MYISFTCAAGKDTTNNVLATGQFVINIVPFERDVLDRVLVCGLPFKPGVSELEKAGLTALAAKVVRPPRIAECRSHFECSVEWTHPWLHRVMICGKVEAVSIDADCLDAKGFIVWDRVKPAHYCGSRYRDRFVPVYDRPTRAVANYDGSDEEFRPGADWRTAYQSRD